MNDMFPTSPNEVDCDQVKFTWFGQTSSACGAEYCAFSHRRAARSSLSLNLNV